jgi:hypothetical protein
MARHKIFIHSHIHTKNVKLLNFLLSQQQLIIDQDRLRINLLNLADDGSQLTRYDKRRQNDYIGKYRNVIWCLAASVVVSVPILNLAIERQWFCLIDGLLRIEQQRKYLTQVDQYGKTALDYACKTDHVPTIKALLLEGAVNGVQNQNQNQSQNWSSKVVKLLNKYFDCPLIRCQWKLESDVAMAAASLNYAYVMAIREDKYIVKKPNSLRGRFFLILSKLPDTCVERILLLQAGDDRELIPRNILQITLRMYERRFFTY